MIVKLKKGENTALPPDLSVVAMGLGWGNTQKPHADGKSTTGVLGAAMNMFNRARDAVADATRQPVDLDASALVFDREGNVRDTVWFRHLTSRDGVIRHSGDDRVGGDKGGDNETITLDLSKLDQDITAIIFTVNSYSGENFADVGMAFCRLRDMKAGGKEVVYYDLTELGDNTAMIMAKLYRHNGEWKFKAIGELGHGRTVEDLKALAKRHL